MRLATAQNWSPAPDPTFYPVDDDMGEGLLHREIAELLRILLQDFLTQKGQVARVGANQFLYWVQFHPEITMAPDVYVLPGVAPETTFDNWKVWETGIVPSFSLEVVSKYPKKDYEEVTSRYADLGVREVVIFDPKAGRPRSRRVRWQVYRRIGKRGLVKVEATNADQVASKVLGCWLRMVGQGSQMRVRVATGAEGERIVPTAVEVAEAAEAKLGAAESARRVSEAKLGEALAEVERLRREVERLQK